MGEDIRKSFLFYCFEEGSLTKHQAETIFDGFIGPYLNRFSDRIKELEQRLVNQD